MYSENDMKAINGRIRKNLLVLAPVLAALLAAYVYALAAGVEWLAMAAGPLIFVAACFGFLAYLWPNLRYRSFLKDMGSGLSRELRGTIAEIGEVPEAQDGARVLPVRLVLDLDADVDGRDRPERRASVEAVRLGLEEPDGSDERIVYLNASKRAGFPGAGAHVALTCFGRHIREAEVV